MKDPRDKTNDKSIAAKADHVESSGHSSGDSAVPGRVGEKATKSHQQSENKPALTTNPIAQVLDQVTKAVDKVQQNAGDLTNAAINAVTHHDLGKQFVDNVSPELANDYQRGKALVEHRRSQGHDPADLSGLNKEQKRQVEAYHKLHAELPAKIPFYNQEALSRQIDLALSQKLKGVPPSTVATAKTTPGPVAPSNRVTANLSGATGLPVGARDGARPQTKTSDIRSSENKAVPTKTTESKVVEPKVTESRQAVVNTRSIGSEQSAQPKAGAPLRSNLEPLPDARDRHSEVKNTEVKNTDKTLPKIGSTPANNLDVPLTSRASIAKNEARPPSSDDQQAQHRHIIAGLQSDNKKDHQAKPELVAKFEQSLVPKAQSRTEDKIESKIEKSVAPNAKASIDQTKVSQGEGVSKNTAAHLAATAKFESGLHSDKADVRHDKATSQSMSTDPRESQSAGTPILQAHKGQEPIGQMRSRTLDSTVPTDENRPRPVGPRAAFYLKDLPIYLGIVQYRTFDRLIKTNLLPLTHSLDSGVEAPCAIIMDQSGGRAHFIRTTPSLPHTDSRSSSSVDQSDTAGRLNSNKTYVSKTVEPTAEQSRRDFVSASEAVHPPVVPPTVSRSTEQVRPTNVPLVMDLTDAPGTVSDTVTKRIGASSGLTISDTTTIKVRDLKYITGAELVFAVIVAVAGTARARGPEQQIEAVRIEAPLAEKATDKGVIASADDVAQLVLDVVSPTATVRPRVIVALTDTLTQIAARLYGDASIAWLIAALNPQCQYHYHLDRCLVKLKVRQTLAVPVFEDLKSFARQRKSYMVAANILTVVEDTAVNKEVLNDTFAALLGLGSLSVDPLQKNKKAEA